MDFLSLHPFVRSTTHDKALGTIIGAALGDAIGVYTEFLPRTACFNAYPTAKFSLTSPTTPFREDSHRDKFSPADWTDDTDQSLLIILSYLHNYYGEMPDGDVSKAGERSLDIGKVVDAQDVAVRIHSWITQGLRCLDRPPLGIGQTIGRVVLDPEYLNDPAATALKIWLKSNRNAAPNGSLMRTHSLGVMCVGKSLEETFRNAAEVGRVTHVDPRCVISCCLATALVRGILRGEVLGEGDVDELIQKAYDWVAAQEELKNPESRKPDGDWEDVAKSSVPPQESKLDFEEYKKHCFAKTLRELQLDDSQKMGYVYKCLGTAVLSLRFAMQRSSDLKQQGSDIFESLVTELIMEGGDADTNACVAGALLGAWFGYSQLPPHWKNGIRNKEWLLQKTQNVALRAGISASCTSEVLAVKNDPDTEIDGGKEFLSKELLDRRERDFIMMILTKQKDRREALEREEKARKGGIGKWFKRDGN